MSAPHAPEDRPETPDVYHGQPPRAGGGHGGPDTPEAQASDAAGQSLANALRVSFRLLTLIMIGVFVAFLLTGFASVESGQTGIIKVLGRTVRTAGPGLAYNWPWPVGQIQVIPTGDRTLVVEDFWLHVDEKDRHKPVKELRPRGEGGLRPGWDGAVLAADRNLVHMKLKCVYRVVDALAYVRHLAGPEETLRSALCDAVIDVAERQTAENIAVGNRQRFLQAVQERAQWRLNRLTRDPLGSGVREGLRRLVRAAGAEVDAPVRASLEAFLAPDAAEVPAGGREQALSQAAERALAELLGDPRAAEVLDEGQRARVQAYLRPKVRIETLSATETTWPLRARGAYEEARKAADDRKRLADEALSEAGSALRRVAGGSWQQLVGVPWLGAEGNRQAREQAQVEYWNLIDDYYDARQRGDRAKMAELDETITRVLLTSGGEASQMLERAQADQTAMTSALQARRNQYEQYLAGYLSNRERFLWNQYYLVKTEILNAPGNEVPWLVPGRGKMVVRISPEPEVEKILATERAEAKKKDEEDAAQRGGRGR